MAQYSTKYYQDTNLVKATGFLSFQTNIDNITSVTEAFGVALELLENDAKSQERLRIIAENTVQYAKQLLIEYPVWDTGALYRSVKSQVYGNEIRVYADATNRFGAPYGTFIEYGYHPFGEKRYIPPRPFIRPALEFARQNTRMNLEDTTRELLQQAARGNFADLHWTNKRNFNIFSIGNRARANQFGQPTQKALSNVATRGRGNLRSISNAEKSRGGSKKGSWDNDRYTRQMSQLTYGLNRHY